MEQQFTAQEQAFMMENLPRYIQQLTDRVMDAIVEQEAAANAEFAEKGIVFIQHSAANADFLTASLLGNLLDKLHGGNLELAQHILTMEAKRLGISLHVD